jgi:glycosyltransferase involved in cell wall biosynthesis
VSPESDQSNHSVVPQRATIIVSTTAEFDSRTQRLARTLAARGHAVTILARAAPGLPRDTTAEGVRIRRVEVRVLDGIPLPAAVQRAGDPGDRAPDRIARSLPTIVSRMARSARVGLAARAQAHAMAATAPAADVVHAMAFLSLPAALAVSRRYGTTPVVYDARDIYADAANVARLPRVIRRAFAATERRWARRAARVVTVNEPYADVLAERIGPPRPLVVMNGPARGDLPPTPQRRFHESLGLAPDQRVVLYHGGFSPDRGIEQLIAALPGLDDRTTLVLLGYGPMRDVLVRRAAGPDLDGRLRVLDAVPPSELLGWVASASVAAMPIQPTTLNHRLTTPNKLFEAMAAGVPVVASNLPGMATIVADVGCGVLCDPTDPADITGAIRAVLDASEDERAGWSVRGREAAGGRYAWETQVESLLAAYGALTGRPW